MGKLSKLRRLRLDRGMTMTKVAEQIGVSDATMSKLEHGTGRPSIDQARALYLLYRPHITLGEIHDPTHPQYTPDHGIPARNLCGVCHRQYVDSEEGEDTCGFCQAAA